MLRFRYFSLLAFFGLIVFSCQRDPSRGRPDTAGSAIPDTVYLQAGNVITASTFDTLRNTLLKEIRNNGIDSAVAFCKVNAAGLTTVYGDSVTVRRTSQRYRNPDNKPDSLEEGILAGLHARANAGDKLAPQLIRSGDAIHFFKPIVMQSLCLNCHGTAGAQVQPNTLRRIEQLYPADRAMSYKEGDLRGVWHIVFRARKQ